MTGVQTCALPISLAHKLGEDAKLRKNLSYMGFVYFNQEEAEAVATAGKLRSYVTQACHIAIKDMSDTIVARKWYVRVGKDKGNFLYAQWARQRVGTSMAGVPGEEKSADYCEAFLGLNWLEEQFGAPLGWGNMKNVYRCIVMELQELYKLNSQVRDQPCYGTEVGSCVRIGIYHEYTGTPQHQRGGGFWSPLEGAEEGGGGRSTKAKKKSRPR